MSRVSRCAIVVLVGSSFVSATAGEPDPLRELLDRWSGFVTAQTGDDPMWQDVKQGAEPALRRAERALIDGRRHLALLRFAAAHEALAAAAYLLERPAEQRRELPAFEAEWRRIGEQLAPELTPRPDACAGLAPASVRAVAEAALPQVRVYRNASLEYGRNTTPDAGLYYLGAAQASHAFGAIARRLAIATTLAAPPVRSLAGELEQLEDELLRAYRPPASLERHGDFIRASATLKDARELDAAGLRYGALLRYLQAVVRTAQLSRSDTADAEGVADALREHETLFHRSGVDHSLGRLLIEMARADLDEGADAPGVVAEVVARHALPRYLAALGPAPPRRATRDPSVTVTLVRWPYT